ncbi:MAG: DMT family transporter [Solirubrobacteraceae bacterium]
MPTHDNASRQPRVALPAGLLLGAIGVLVFSFSLPATKLALRGFDPWLVAFGRATVASVLAAALMRRRRVPAPSPEQLRRLLIVAGGVVIGFPTLTSLALQSSGSAHGAVVIAILPIVTAVFAVARGGEPPGRTFWAAALAGMAIIGAFAVSQAHGGLTGADALELAAVLACGLGYAEGGALARELGGARTICWALVASAPLTGAAAVAALCLGPAPAPGAVSLFGLAYVSIGSMLLGFFAWYAGLARGGIARIGQVQLAQPLFTVAWSALVLGERVTPAVLLAAVGVLAAVSASQRARIRRSAQPRRRARAPRPVRADPHETTRTP